MPGIKDSEKKAAVTTDLLIQVQLYDELLKISGES